MKKVYTQLSMEERAMIQTQLEIGFNPSAIAAGLKRSPSTIMRELWRNGWVGGKNRSRPGRPRHGYRAVQAHKRARHSISKARTPRKLLPGNALWEHVIWYLKAGCSPEQIAGILAAVHPDTPTLRVSHETIYTAIYAMPRGELRTEVIGWLRFGRAKRRPRVRGEVDVGRFPTWSTSMTGRPKLMSG